MQVLIENSQARSIKETSNVSGMSDKAVTGSGKKLLSAVTP